MRRMAILVTLSIMLAWSLPGPAALGQVVKIGVVGPLTGPVSPTGLMMRNGIQLAVNEINEAGGIKGVGKVELVIEDSKCIPAEGVNAVQKLVHRDRVAAVLGDVCSFATIAEMKVTERGETPQMTPVSASHNVTEQGNKWVFMVQAVDRLAAALVADFAVKDLKLKKLAIIHDQSEYGKDGADVIEATLKKYGITVVARESFRFRDVDFTGQLLKIKDKAPEGLFLWGIYGEISLIMKQSKQLGMKFIPLASDAQAYPDYIKLAGEAAEGTITEAVFVATDPDPKVQAFIKKYQAAFGEVPDPGAALGYDAMNVLAAAVQRAGSADRAKIRDALATLPGHSGVTGETKFNERGENVRGNFIILVKGGKHYRY